MTVTHQRLWNYFLTLERDFAATTAFVELHPSNFKTFSDRYAGLILLVGSEVDVVAKQLTKREVPSAPAKNIENYQTALCSRYPKLHSLQVSIFGHDLKLQPWESWGRNPPSSPSWWKAYNHVKHDRTVHIQEASQINALNGLCGLFLLNLYFNANPEKIWPYPKLLGNEFFPDIIVHEADETLPDL